MRRSRCTPPARWPMSCRDGDCSECFWSCSGRFRFIEPGSLCSRLMILHSKRRPSSGRSHVHTQPFAFRASRVHHESVKMSNTTPSRSSALLPTPQVARPRAACLQKRQFLFSTNEALSRSSNFATATKQSTSFFLFSTNERSPIIAHQSLITGTHPQHQPARRTS